MSEKQNNHHLDPHADESAESLERLLIDGIDRRSPDLSSPSTPVPFKKEKDDEEEEEGQFPTSDLQGAYGLYAEAAQDMATAGVELGLGRHFACADFCNQAAEKAAQAVSLLRFGRRSSYNHDLKALAILVGAPPEIQEEMAVLTPFHPEDFYMDTPPEEADEVINADQASGYVQRARRIMRWARNIVLGT